MNVDVVVVGAGPSGLAAVRHLVDAGRSVLGVERHEDVGGIWDIDNPGSPMYESAHLISSRTQSALDAFPMGDDLPDYPSHRQLLGYLRDYADARGLRRHFRFETSVESATPRDGGGWDVTLSDGTAVVARDLVLATGNQWHPHLPDIPGEFFGDVFHSREHRDAARFDGKRVLVIGAGNSGCDIACDAAVRADHASISVRRGYRFVPKWIFGLPSDVFAHRGPTLPAAVEQRVFTQLLDRLVGDVTRFGLPAPDHDVFASHPIMNTTILDHLGHGDLTARADVARFDGDTVHFVDGTSDEFDVVVLATGFRPRFPVVDEDVFDWHGPNPNLFLNVFHRTRDDLFVLGMIETDASAWPAITTQAALVTQWLTVRDEAGDAANAFRSLRTSDLDLEGGVQHVDSQRHAYYQRSSTYDAVTSEVARRLQARSTDDSAIETGVTSALRRVGRRVRDRLPI